MAAFTRRRTEGAGGFFGIERMTKGRTILVGGVVMDHEVEAEGGPSRAARAGSQKNGPGKLVQAGAAKSGRRYFCRLCQSPVKVPLPRPFGERPPSRTR